MRPSTLAVAAVLACATAAAHADTFQTFQLSLSFEHGIGVGGQIVLDTTTNQFTSLGAVAGGLPTGGSYNGIRSQGVSNGDYFVTAATSGAYGLSIILPVTTLAGYEGSDVCTESLGPGCFSASTLDFPATAGTLTPLAPAVVTPELSTLALLATGTLALTGLLRRRCRFCSKPIDVRLGDRISQRWSPYPAGPSCSGNRKMWSPAVGGFGDDL